MRFEETERRVYSWLVTKVPKASKAKYRRTFIRAWRGYRGYTLTQLENLMEKAPGEPLITGVSIGRIERGEQPYSQPILEALAAALRCTTWELLEVDPTKEGEVIDLMRIIRGMDEAGVRQLTKIAKTF